MNGKKRTKNVQESSGFVIPKPMNKTIVVVAQRLRSKLALIIVLGLLLVAGIGAVVVYGIYHNSGNKSEESSAIGAETTKLIQDADLLAGKGQAEQAIALIDSRDKVATTNLEKATLKSTQAQYALNGGDADQAISFARSANKVSERATTHALIGYAAEQKQDWQLAADSYARAVQLSEPTEPGEISPYNDYKIRESEMRSKL